MARGAVKVVSINGALTVTFTAASGATPAVFSDEACTSAITLPATVSDGASTTFYFASPGSYTLSVKTSSGIQIAGDLNTTKVVTVSAGDVGVYAYDARLVAKDFSGDSGRHSPNTDLSATYVSVGQSRVDVTGKYGGDIAAAIAAEGHGKHFIFSSPITPASTITLDSHDVLEGTPGALVGRSTDAVTIAIAAGAEHPVVRNFRLSNSFTGTRTTYDIEAVNPYKPVLEHVEIALAQTSLVKGGVHFYKDAGQANGLSQLFMPQLSDVWIRNGTLAVEDITDGKVTDSFIWGTYTGAPGTVQLTRASNWTFDNVDVVPPQGNAGGYLLQALNNLSIIGGLLDGSYDSIMTGHGIMSTDFVRGLSVVGVKFFNLGRSALNLFDVRRSAVLGCIFVQGNKEDNFYPDINLTSANDNTFFGNTHGAPNARTNKGRIYVEDGASSDNLVAGNALEINSAIVPNGHYYDTGLFTVQSSTLVKDNRPAANWPTSTLLLKSSNYTATKDDLFTGRSLIVTGTTTITLPSAGSVHAGDILRVKNTGTAVVTLATTSSQTIDGATTRTLYPGQAVTVQSDGSNWAIATSRGATAAVVAPPLSMLQTVAATAWPTANMAIFQRFTLEADAYLRYVNHRVDGASGNMQVGVVQLSGAGLTAYTRVMDSGVIATPAAADYKRDLGATRLPAGEYAVYEWFDNTTATTRVASNSGISSMRLSAEVTGLGSGVPSSGTVAWSSTRFLGGVTVEQDV